MAPTDRRLSAAHVVRVVTNAQQAEQGDACAREAFEATAQQTRYLRGVEKTGTLTAGCKAAKVSPHTVYRWRETEPFAEAERIANDTFADALEQEAVRRAWRGVKSTIPIVHKGETVGEIVKTEYSDTLMVMMLKAVRPEKYRERKSTDIAVSGQLEHKAVVDDASAQLLADLIAGGLASRDNSRTSA